MKVDVTLTAKLLQHPEQEPHRDGITLFGGFCMVKNIDEAKYIVKAIANEVINRHFKENYSKRVNWLFASSNPRWREKDYWTEGLNERILKYNQILGSLEDEYTMVQYTTSIRYDSPDEDETDGE